MPWQEHLGHLRYIACHKCCICKGNPPFTCLLRTAHSLQVPRTPSPHASRCPHIPPGTSVRILVPPGSYPNLRSPFSEPVNLWISLTNDPEQTHSLWSSPHHLRSFLGPVTQMSGDSEIRRFGDSEIRWFSGSQPPPNNLRRNHGGLDLGPLSLIPAPASASPWS